MTPMPIVVAEVSANHAGSLKTALELVRAVASAGVGYVKFQTYTPDTMTLDCAPREFTIDPKHELWGGRSLYSLYSEAQTPWSWFEELFKVSRELGIVPFSTPFDVTAVEFLETLNPELYKIASLEVGDLRLIRRVAETGKPMVISTGAASLSEIDDAVAAADQAGCPEITLLLCTSSYPTRPTDVHLARMGFLQERYGVPVGLSDHTTGTAASVAATALGAVMIERHVTLKRDGSGPDSAFSLEPDELSQLVEDVRTAWEAIGDKSWVELPCEAESRRLKRSLFVTRDCSAGEVLDSGNIQSIRPAGGLPPHWYDHLLGRKFGKPVKRGTPLTLDLLDNTDHLSQEGSAS